MPQSNSQVCRATEDSPHLTHSSLPAPPLQRPTAVTADRRCRAVRILVSHSHQANWPAALLPRLGCSESRNETAYPRATGASRSSGRHERTALCTLKCQIHGELRCVLYEVFAVKTQQLPICTGDIMHMTLWAHTSVTLRATVEMEVSGESPVRTQEA